VTRNQRRWLAAILVVSAALRVWWVVYAARPPVGLHDPNFYTFHAQRFARGHGYTLPNGQPSAYYPVGYPLTLSGVFWLVYHSAIPDDFPRVIGFFNAALGVGTVGLVFVVARRLFDTNVGLVAAALVGLWPNLIFHTGAALTETLFNFLVMAALAVLFAPPRDASPSWVRLGTVGLLFGYASLVRPPSLAFAPALLVAWLVAKVGWRVALLRAAVVVSAMLVVLLPWVVRNARVMHIVNLSTNTGDNLCIGRNPEATGAFGRPAYCFPDLADDTRPAYEVRRNDIATNRALRYLRGHPADEVRLAFWRGYYTFRSDHDGLDAVESYGLDPFIRPRTRSVLQTVADGWFFGAGALALLGLPAFLTRADPRRLFFVVAMASIAVAPFIFFGDPRFHVPCVPFLAVLAAVAMRQRYGRHDGEEGEGRHLVPLVPAEPEGDQPERDEAEQDEQAARMPAGGERR
jgi:hypothetical protein